VAARAVEKYVQNGTTVGLGSGRLVALIAERLSSIEHRNRKIVVVPGCDVASQEAAYHELDLRSLDKVQKVDVTFHDVDQLDDQKFAAVHGVESEPAQPQLLQIQRLAAKSTQFVALVDGPDKVVPRLEGNLPVLVQGDMWEDAAEELDDIFVGDAEVWRRSNQFTKTPRAEDPYEDSDGNNILDIKFRVPMVDPQVNETMKLDMKECPYEDLLSAVEGVDGVVAHGLLLDVSAAIVVSDDGPVEYEPEPEDDVDVDTEDQL